MDLGVPRGGAADPLALAAMGELVGAAAPPSVEMTLVGATFAVRQDCLIGVTGADFGAVIAEEDRQLRPGTTTLVRAGTTVRFGTALDGARAYLSLASGIDIPTVLGSASTCLAGQFGGMDGRALRRGDLLLARARDATAIGTKLQGRASGVVDGDGPRTLRVVAGPHSSIVGSSVLEALLSTELEISSRSDRVGVRLDGFPDAVDGAERGELVSLPMVWGAVQLPPGGQPICLLPDHQTVGGYAVPLVVIAADRPVLGQLRPLDRITFRKVSIDQARRLGFPGVVAVRS